MMLPRVCGRVAGTLLGIATLAAAQAQSVQDLVPFVPDDANAISILRVQALTDSPRGRELGWAEKHESGFLEGSVTLPPWVEVLLRASHVRPGTRGGDWTVALLPLPDDYDMSLLAEREGTEVQEISDHFVVASPRHNGYFVELHGKSDGGRRLLGGISPSTRQELARWIGDLHGRLGLLHLSEFLLDATRDESPQIVLAFDLEHMLDPIMIRYRLDGAVALENDPIAKAALTLDFQTLKGLLFTVRVEQEITAELRLDFGRQIGPEGKYVKPLVIEFFNDAGAALDELEDARVDVDGRSVTLQMPLSDESLRRILSLVTAPPPPTAAGRAPADPPAPASEGPDVKASRRYFSAANKNIDDLQRAYGRAKSYTRTAQWHENFAQRIGNLPTSGVDPELIEYGRTISAHFRALAASLRGTGIEVDALDKSVVYNVDYNRGYWQSGWSWWGPRVYGQPGSASVTSNLQEVRAQQAAAVTKSAPERDQVWQMINDERAAMERKMVGRYGDDFR